MSEFIRCTSRAKHGGRCWRSAHGTGKHLVLPPEKTPTLAQIERIIAARPDVNREVMFRAVLAEHASPGPRANIGWMNFDEVFKDMDRMFDKMGALFGEVLPPRK